MLKKQTEIYSHLNKVSPVCNPKGQSQIGIAQELRALGLIGSKAWEY